MLSVSIGKAGLFLEDKSFHMGDHHASWMSESGRLGFGNPAFWGFGFGSLERKRTGHPVMVWRDLVTFRTETSNKKVDGIRGDKK